MVLQGSLQSAPMPLPTHLLADCKVEVTTHCPDLLRLAVGAVSDLAAPERYVISHSRTLSRGCKTISNLARNCATLQHNDLKTSCSFNWGCNYPCTAAKIYMSTAKG